MGADDVLLVGVHGASGAEPHGKPDSSRVDASQTTRFSGDKGIGTSFGTGSAAPWTGDDSIKAVAALFNTTSHLGQPQQQAQAEVSWPHLRAGLLSAMHTIAVLLCTSWP